MVERSDTAVRKCKVYSKGKESYFKVYKMRNDTIKSVHRKKQVQGKLKGRFMIGIKENHQNTEIV